MKLQGKKTGTVAGFIGYIDEATVIELPSGEYMLTVRYKDAGAICYKHYSTIAEFNADWEDYKEAEPLIKDEKIRKLVSNWAKLTQTTKILTVNRRIVTSGERFTEFFSRDSLVSLEILGRLDCLNMKEYDISELCGEEE